jgi:hypothetical protein
MSVSDTAAISTLRRPRVHRLIRQLHIWIGAWGAIAAVLFGFSGFMQNHRGIMKLPQGSSTEVANIEISVSEEARASPEALKAWLANSRRMELKVLRGSQGGPRGAGRGEGRSVRWVLFGGNARNSIQVEYIPGSETAIVRSTVQSPLAVLERLHEGVGGGVAWILLSDSFALGLVALGASGLVMWSRGRTPRQMVVSIVGAATAVFILIVANAIV